MVNHDKAFIDSEKHDLEIWVDQSMVFTRARAVPLPKVATDPRVYGEAPHQIWPKGSLCIYFSPGDITPESFRTLRECFVGHSEAASNAFDGHLGAIVYGTESQFSQSFTGPQGDSLVVAPDGQVYWVNRLNHMLYGQLGKGKVLQVQVSWKVTESPLDSYKNKAGQSITQAYDVRGAESGPKAAPPGKK